MCIPSAKAQQPIIPPTVPRMSDPNVSGARSNQRKPYGYSSTVLTGALAPASSEKTRALGGRGY